MRVYPEYFNNDNQEHSSIKLEHSQLKDNVIAGNNMTIRATIQDMSLNDKINDVSLFIGPEILVFYNVVKGDKLYQIGQYIANLDDMATKTNPNALNEKMERFRRGRVYKPIFMERM